MHEIVIQAYDTVKAGLSSDRVVVDPDLNDRFIAECRKIGLKQGIEDLNWTLLNLRKSGALAGRPRAIPTRFSDEDDYRFAAEIAARYMERKSGLSLDRILCNPTLRLEFDGVAERIAPGYTPLRYRWAALNLRKARLLEPELVARIVPPLRITNVSVDKLVPSEVPATQGIYLFLAADQLLYVGETENLRKRISKHLEHSDNKGLARWIWEFGTDGLNLELQELDPSTETRIRKALELELIRSRDPLFNVKR